MFQSIVRSFRAPGAQFIAAYIQVALANLRNGWLKMTLRSITKITRGQFHAHLLRADGVSQEKDLPSLRTCIGIAGWHTVPSQQEKAIRIPKLSASFVEANLNKSQTLHDTRLSHVHLGRVDYWIILVYCFGSDTKVHMYFLYIC